MAKIRIGSEPKKVLGIPLLFLWVFSIASVGAVAFINMTYANYDMDANSAFFVFNGSSQMTQINGVGGDLFEFNYSIFNNANQQMNYHVVVNCSEVGQNDVFLRVDNYTSTSGRVETDNIQLSSRQLRYGSMYVQFNQTFMGNGRCDFMVNQGDFTWARTV